MKGDYHFWQDFFDTYQSLSDWMKFAWLVIPPGFLLTLVALILRYRLMNRHTKDIDSATLAYTVRKNESGDLQIYTHEGADRLSSQAARPKLLPLPEIPPLSRKERSPLD